MNLSVVFWARAGFLVLLAFVTYQTLIAAPDPTASGLAIAQWISEVIFNEAISDDKVAHFLGYFALGVTACFARLTPFGNSCAALIGLVLYGGLLEVLQELGGVRAAEFSDAVANALGAVSGFALAYFFNVMLSSRVT